MLSHVNAMLDHHATLYTAGTFAEATRFYTYPLPVHLQDELVVKPTRADHEIALRRMVDAYKARGVLRVAWTMSAIDLPRGGRFRVWTAWDHVHADKVIPGACNLIQFCRLQGDRLTVEMIHFVNSSLFPAANDPVTVLRSA